MLLYRLELQAHFPSLQLLFLKKKYTIFQKYLRFWFHLLPKGTIVAGTGTSYCSHKCRNTVLARQQQGPKSFFQNICCHGHKVAVRNALSVVTDLFLPLTNKMLTVPHVILILAAAEGVMEVPNGIVELLSVCASVLNLQERLLTAGNSFSGIFPWQLHHPFPCIVISDICSYTNGQLLSCNISSYRV